MEKKMTIAQALNELKLLDKKLRKKINSNFVGVRSAGKILDGFDADEAKKNLDSISK